MCKKGENAVGIFTLPIGLYCDVDCLKTYDAIVAGKQIKIDFPQYVEPEEKSIEMGSIIAPPAAKNLRRGEEKLAWGNIDHITKKTAGGIIQLIAIECEEKDVQVLYDHFNPWIERFLMYCFLCNKQFCYTLDITASGGNRLELVGKNGYIHPETRQEIAMTFYCIPDEVYLRREHIEKAIEYASSNKTIRPEFEFLQQAYEAEKKHEHKLAIIHACSGLESCLLQQIDRYCNQRIIETDILTKKYKYLSDLVELGSRIDSEFAQLKEELKENVCKARNAVVHFNRNAAPNRETALKCIEAVEKALRYFYDDFAE